MTDTIIIKADKGDSVVILDTVHYLSLAYNHLNDRTTYGKLESDVTLEISQHLQVYLSKLFSAGYIDSITSDFLKPCTKLRTQRMYFLPKLHKNPLAVHPIVSCCSGPTEGISALLDFFFQPCMKSVSSYLANSTQLINILQTTCFSPNCFLVTMDVASLYTNITHEDAVETIFHIYSHLLPSPYRPPIFVLIDLL